jgi:hypothetical protein
MNCTCKVDQRRLTPGVFNLKQYLNGTETMTWTVDNCLINEGTCDLKQYDAFLTLSVGGEIDEILLTKRQEEDNLKLVWNVGQYATALTGHVKYQISFRSATFDTLGVIANDPEANGVYTLTDQNATGNNRVYSKAENGHNIKWDATNGRWALYSADGAVIDYQTTPSTEPHCGAWGEVAVGNNEAAVWISDEAIMYVSDSIAADQKVTANYPTILRQLWAKINKAGVTSVNGKSGIVELAPADIGAAEDKHGHEIKDVSSLQETLNNKAPKSHQHTMADVTDLQAELNKKAAASHGHKITDTEGLQDALNSKAPKEHSHTISNVNGLQEALNKKTPATHTETKATNSVLGHVKVDGETIVAEDGVIKAVGGLPIGSIYSHPGSVPPPGAYLLNGQTIPNCRETYKQFWAWLETAGVRIINNSTFEAEIAKYGVCDGFVIDTSAGSVRLPKWHYQSPLPDILGVRGNGLALGFTGDFSITDSGYALWCNNNGTWFSNKGFGKEIGTSGGASFPASKHYGITGNTDYSGLVAEVTSASNNFVLCIQVYNTTTALSEQDSAQLASIMQTKAQTDLANVTANVDFVIESWNDENGNWYRKYRSGWIEQGGVSEFNTAAGIVTFIVEFSTTKFTVTCSQTTRENSHIDTGGVGAGPEIGSYTTTSFHYSMNKATTLCLDWRACGY